MNDLCADIGYYSVNHVGEELCGDNVEVVENDDGIVAVLADGLGSGVKANILATLTSKIISTMIARGLSIEDCVETIAATLPVCSVRGVAYSTFTIIKINRNKEAEIFQYDNPHVIMFRDGVNYDYQKSEINIDGKKIFKSVIRLKENDIFIAMSDGCPHAGVGNLYNFGWQLEDITNFMESFTQVGFTAKTLAKILVDECYRLYGEKPGDDTTACVLRIRKREAVNLLFGPPMDRNDTDKMMSLFFSKEGTHIICGGTTSTIAAAYLGKELKPTLDFVDKDIPPIATIEGVDLVTEGVITINRVVEYAKDYLGANEQYQNWSVKRDGASLISRVLFEDATDINFYVGRAINPAHQNPDLPINFNIKMNLIKELSEALRKMGKRVKVSYF
ncbi:MAG: SpoIIE family protein phosphatase [Oscillospiraceae bacterium]|nr:SpoIIE family protein phosphatase [Oscillospiraceae bacterium]MDD6146003.1 SpoIIE family protein phosphatase [Oscillospiraceae bacterium]